MKDVDIVSCYIDSLVNKYFVAALLVRENDVRQRPFLYNFDVFFNCSNPRHIQNADILPEHTTVPTVPTPLILYHTSIRFSLSYSSIFSKSALSSFSRVVVPPKYITWLSFDSVLNPFGSY